MVRIMSIGRGAIAKATGLIKALDEYNEESIIIVNKVTEVFKGEIPMVTGTDKKKMVGKMGMKGYTFFEHGSHLMPNLLKNWEKEIKASQWGYDKLYNRIKESSNNFSLLIKSNFAFSVTQIRSDPNIYQRAIKIKADRETYFQENFENMKNVMEPLECSEYGAIDPDMTSFNYSDIDDKSQMVMEDDEEFDDQGSYDYYCNANVYKSDIFDKLGPLLQGIKKIWKDKESIKNCDGNKENDYRGGNSVIQKDNRPQDVDIKLCKEDLISKKEPLSALKNNFSVGSPLRQSR